MTAPNDGAIRAEIQRRLGVQGAPKAEVPGTLEEGYLVGFLSGARWVRDEFIDPEPQGEPSDAQARAAARAWIGAGEPDQATLWSARAALRAAALEK